MKKLHSKGFGLVEVLLALVVCAILVIGSWAVYNKINNTRAVSNTPAVQQIEATDSANIFSYNYPDTWQIKPYVWENCCEGPDQVEPDWSKESKPVTLHPDGNEEATISITMDPYGDYWKSNFEELRAFVKEDFFAKVLFEAKRDDGHEALFSRVDYLGPPDAKVESFTDHRYYFDNGTAVLRVNFREKYHHDWYPENEINHSQYAQDFERIANSIRFLK